jgi:hypothetical protein
MNKDFILAEIRRTASANGGVPLGAQRFETETGIRKPEWLGKIWARWSEALREAGFAPNELKGAYQKGTALEKYARLAQELGRLPAANDIRLKGRTEPGFPSHSVFGRLRSKATLVTALGIYCKERPEFADVGELCEAFAPRVTAASDGSVANPEIGSELGLHELRIEMHSGSNCHGLWSDGYGFRLAVRRRSTLAKMTDGRTPKASHIRNRASTVGDFLSRSISLTYTRCVFALNDNSSCVKSAAIRALRNSSPSMMGK